MIVSGLTLESKKNPLNKKGQKIQYIQQKRPDSTQFPQINETRAFTINKFRHKEESQKQRNKSYNKIYMTNKIGQKREEFYLLSQANKNPPNDFKTKTKPDENRKFKKVELIKGEQICQYQQQEKLLAFYRYYPLTIIGVSGMRQQIMKSLNEKGDFSTFSIKGKKMIRIGIQQTWNKLIKTAMLKGKYKYRQKFNFAHSAQLKSIGFKRRQNKKRKQSSSSASDEDNDNERRQKCRDMQAWKRSVGAEGSKIFIVKGKYKDLRNALLERGWIQNQDNQSLFYDLKWTTKVSDVNFESVKPHQIVNHFNNNACLTSKYGICKSLRSIMFSESVDVDKFFPKAYDLSDVQDFQNFLQVYKWNYCESILKGVSSIGAKTKEEQIRIKLSFIITYRRMLKAQKLIVNLLNSKYNLCSINEWKCLTSPKDCDMQSIFLTIQQWELLDIEWQDIIKKCQTILEKLQSRDPQFNINGTSNIWIVKPAFLSRGRGIKCISQLNDILDYGLGKETQYVVQKYIENPLIINKRKFDIRQWVIVQDYCPPKIWFYLQFYVRFCLQAYNPSKLNNKFAHLTNNSIQKHNSKINAEELANESMWSMDQLKQFCEQRYNEGKFKEIIAKMKQIVVSTILSTQDQVHGRRNSFQLLGYDFMIDENLCPWLIEINSSPSMDYSTPITRRLVKMVLEDTVKVMVDVKKKKGKKKTVGLFKCIYDGQSKYLFKHYKMMHEEQN